LGQITSAAEDALALVAAGDNVIEIDPKKIDISFIQDRFGQNPEEHRALVDSIRIHGQQVPILVRPHPEKRDRYQIAYGHRRLRASIELDRPIRAVVRNLNDVELVIAQGQENSARLDLSFIERVSFALALEDRGFDRNVIMAALNIGRTQISKLTALGRSIPAHIIVAVGSAPKAGRPRWNQLAERLNRAAPDSIDLILNDPSFQHSDTDARFVRLLEALSPNKRPRLSASSWTDENGLKVVRIERGSRKLRMTVDEDLVPEFGDFILERIPELYRQFRKARSDKGT
jgi:ParB family chromosome partitioning protein